MSVTTGGGTRTYLGVKAEPGLLQVAAVPARLGRIFTAADRGKPVAVVSDAFWRGSLHGDPHVIGHGLQVNSKSLTVIGVMPPGFFFPLFSPDEMVYTLAEITKQGRDENDFVGAEVAARLKPGVSLQSAEAELSAIYARYRTADEPEGTVVLRSYTKNITQDEQPGLLMLLAACGVLLLIACANTANLQLIRGFARVGELRLLAAARHVYGKQFPRFEEVHLSPAAFAGCALLAAAAGLLAALAPASVILREAKHLHSSTPVQASRYTSRSRVGSALVIAEIALTAILLAIAGLFIRTVQALEHAPLGFDPQHLTVVTTLPLDPHQSPAAQREIDGQLLARLNSLPGINAATTATSLPFSRMSLAMGSSFAVTGQPVRKDDVITVMLVDDHYTRAMGTAMLTGRSLNADDVAGALPVCMVNQAFARQYLDPTRPVGATLRFLNEATDGTDERILQSPLTVVGIMPDQVNGRQIDNRVDPIVFLDYRQARVDYPLAHFMFGIAPQFAVRSALPQAVLDREIRTALKQEAPGYAERSIEPVSLAIHESLTNRLLALRLASGFGAVALLLAAVGIYGVLAYTVARRTREIGIRMALGSTRGQALQLVARQAAVLAMTGIALGILGAWPAGRVVRSTLFGVGAFDPVSIAAAVLLLLLACALATALPATRAVRVDPTEALRAE